MQLTDDEKRIRDGRNGTVARKCMEFLIAYGEAAGAERLVDLDGTVDLHPGQFWVPDYRISPEEIPCLQGDEHADIRDSASCAYLSSVALSTVPRRSFRCSWSASVSRISRSRAPARDRSSASVPGIAPHRRKHASLATSETKSTSPFTDAAVDS